MSRSTIKGAASFKRLLRALPQSANDQIVQFLNDAGPVLVAKMKEQIPVLKSPRPDRRPGAARDSISFKVTPKTLNLKVGEITKKDRIFYAHILDVGRKAQTVTVTRTGNPYTMRVPAMAPRYIISKTRASFRLETLPGYRNLIEGILQRAARGAGSD